MADRGRETSYALVEVRTVLKRAETALDNVDRYCINDPDRLDMIEALKQTVNSLRRWQRTGRPL